MNLKRVALGVAFGLTAGAGAVAQDAVKVDSRIPEYQQTEGVSGTIKSVGSDTMNNLMALWAEGFRKMYPNVQAEIEGKGSSTAPPALIKGTSTFGPMSRLMKAAEVDQFEERFGYKPTPLRTSIDMLAVFVHKDNPIVEQGLSLEQLDGIFSQTYKSGHSNVTTWGDLGLRGEWANKPISIYGRNSASGTYGYFKKHALFGGDYKDTVKEQPGSSAVVQGVASDKFAIGYSGIGYKTADVAVVPIAEDSNSKPVPATADTVADYPLARFLYMYVNYKPGSRLDPLRGEFIKYVFSQEGQEAVLKDGYLPVNGRIAMEELQKVNLR
jgi:phosphate transport system substrate-binding protein